MLSLGEKALPVDPHYKPSVPTRWGRKKKKKETRRYRSVEQGREGEESDKLQEGNSGCSSRII